MEKMGFKIDSLNIKSKAMFNRDGVGLIQEVEVPFPEINLDIDISTDASENDLMKVQKQLAMYCPIAKVIRNSGTKLMKTGQKLIRINL